MPAQASGPQDNISSAESDVQALSRQVLDSWNQCNSAGFADLFSTDGQTVGFDGSSYNGRTQIESAHSQIFAQHQTPAYVAIVRAVRFLATEVAVLSAVAGMVPPGRSDLNPAVNAIQTFLALKKHDRWRVALFQNTPPAFHDRPDLSEGQAFRMKQP